MATCPICISALFEPHEPDDVTTTLCGHVFHSSCIRKWTAGKSQKKCPCCRDAIDLGSLVRLHVNIESSALSSCPGPLTSAEEPPQDADAATVQAYMVSLKEQLARTQGERDLAKQHARACEQASAEVQEALSELDSLRESLTLREAQVERGQIEVLNVKEKLESALAKVKQQTKALANERKENRYLQEQVHTLQNSAKIQEIVGNRSLTDVKELNSRHKGSDPHVVIPALERTIVTANKEYTKLKLEAEKLAQKCLQREQRAEQVEALQEECRELRGSLKAAQEDLAQARSGQASSARRAAPAPQLEPHGGRIIAAAPPRREQPAALPFARALSEDLELPDFELEAGGPSARGDGGGPRQVDGRREDEAGPAGASGRVEAWPEDESSRLGGAFADASSKRPMASLGEASARIPSIHRVTGLGSGLAKAKGNKSFMTAKRPIARSSSIPLHGDPKTVAGEFIRKGADGRGGQVTVLMPRSSNVPTTGAASESSSANPGKRLKIGASSFSGASSSSGAAAGHRTSGSGSKIAAMTSSGLQMGHYFPRR